MKKYILTIGLNDKDTKLQKFDTITAYKIVENLLKEHTTGYTIYETHGGYLHDDKTFVSELSLRVELMFITRKQIITIIKTLKQVLNQETIALEIVKSNSKLI